MKSISFLLVGLLAVSGIAVAQQSEPRSERPFHQHMEDRLKGADTNKDGLISRDEAKALPHLLAHFDAIDTNKDGQLSSDELKAMAAKMPRRGFHGRGGHEHLPVTREELVKRSQQMLADFDTADANKDGKLSPDEMKVWHEQMRAHRPQRKDAPAK